MRAISTRRYEPQQAVDALWPRSPGIAPAPPTPAAREAFAALVPRLAAAPPVTFVDTSEAMALAGRAHAVGFLLELWHVDARWFWVLRERPDARRGAGAYVFRAPSREETNDDDARVLILQAPHAYFDLRTGLVAASILFGRTPGGPQIDAFMTNTVHRHQKGPDRRVKEAHDPADVCHNPDHLFQHVTTLAADAAGDRPVVLVQLHGFGADDTDDTGDAGTNEPGLDAPGADGSPDLIVSAGRSAGSSRHSTAVARALARGFGSAAVRRYPEEIQRLGGTTNVQGRMLRERPDSAFLHIEMSAGLRKRLVADPERLAAFGEAVLEHPSSTLE